jgi:hypothetical protein
MRIRKFLTRTNKLIFERKLKEYMDEVLSDEEYLDTYEKCREDVRRVKCWNGGDLTVAKCRDWLQGLPIGTEFVTYKICVMLFSWLGMEEKDVARLGKDFEETEFELDNYYWDTLAWIIRFGR